MRDYARDLGLSPAEYYMTFSDEKKDLRLKCVSTGEFDFEISSRYVEGVEDCLQEEGMDVWYFELASYASPGKSTPMTPALAKQPIAFFITVLFHEMDHNSMESNLGPALEESSAMLIGIASALKFSAEYFGEQGTVTTTLQGHLEERRLVSELYIQYAEQLETLFADTSPSQESMRTVKTALYRTFRQECKALGLRYLAGFCYTETNNAFFATHMLYMEYFPLMHDLYVAQGEDVAATIEYMIDLSRQDQIISFSIGGAGQSRSAEENRALDIEAKIVELTSEATSEGP